MMKKTIIAMIAVLAAAVGFAGDSAPFLLDTVTTSTSPIVDSLSISWDAAWIGGDSGATVVIADNGIEVRRATGVGEFTHTLSGGGRHELTYTTYIDEVLQEEIYRTVVFKGKYTIHFDANGGNGVMEDCKFVDEKPSILPKGLFTKDGYFFLGWALAPDGDAALFDGDSTIDIVADEGETVTLYAVWHEGVGGGKGLSVKYYDISSSGYSTWTQSEAAMTSYFAAYTPTISTNTLSWGDLFDAGFQYQGSSSSSIFSGFVDWDNAGVSNNRFHGKYSQRSQNNFAMEFNGSITVPSTGDYGFGTIADNDIVLYIDGVKICDARWNSSSFGLFSLSAGRHRIRIGFYEDTGEQGLLLQWKKPGDATYSPLPQTVLSDGVAVVYAVHFDANGGNGSMPKRVYAAGDDVALPDGVFTRDGWTLVGWATDPDGPAIYATHGAIDGGVWAAEGQTVTLYARWAQSQYAIHFDPNGGEGAMPDKSLWVGIPDWLSSNEFSRVGHTFAGWSASPDGEVEYADKDLVTNLTEIVNATVNLYAVWTPHQYRVRFNGGTGTGSMSNQQLTYDVAASLISNTFMKVGYTFAGWATEANGAKVYEDGGDVLNLVSDENAVVDLYATWTPNEYAVTFDALDGVVDGGSSGDWGQPPSRMVTFDSAYGELPTASCDGYVFLGWLLDGISVDSNTVVKTTANHTLTAKWAVEIGGGTFELTIDEDSVTLGAQITSPSGDVIIPSEVMGRPVVSINDGAFEGCSGLTSVTIPDSITHIGDSAFSGCIGLSDMRIPGRVEYLGSEVFDGCSGLTNIVIESDAICRSGLKQAKFNTRFDTASSLEDSDEVAEVSGVIAAYQKVTASPWQFTDPVTGATYAWNERDTTFAYFGEMYMEAGKTYVFGAHFDDDVYVKVAGQVLISRQSTSGYSILTGSYSCQKSGWYDVEFRLSDATGGKGSWGNTWSSDFGLGYRDDGGTSTTQSAWKRLIDPGDASLLRCDVGRSLGNCPNLTSITMPAVYRPYLGDTLNGCPITYIATVQVEVEGCDAVTISAPYGMAIGELPGLHPREGYSVAVFTAKTGGVQVSTDTIITNNMTIYAQWTANEYQVTFNAAGGEVDGDGGHAGRVTLPVTYDSEYGDMPTASCEGYVFLGWTLDGMEVAATNIVKTADDHTLKAKWGIRFGNGIWAATVHNRPITLGAPLVPPSGEVEIPATIAGRPVAGITAAAFAGNVAVTGVTVRASVNVEAGALGAIPCTVIVDDDGQYIADAIAGNVRKVVFAEGVTRIGDNYFRVGENGHAGRVTLPNLETIDIAESVVRIGTNVFEAASALETVVTNGLVLCQGWCLGFAGESTGGTPVVPVNGQDARSPSIPEGVRGIAAGAFEGEYGIEMVEFPSTLRFVGAGAFRDCTGLGDIVLPEGVVAVDREAFRNCTYAQGLDLPTTLEEIGDGAFANCTSVGGVTVPDGVADIGEYAFSNCWRMMSAAIPASVTNVGVGAFADCRRLAGVTVPFGVGTMAELFPAAYGKITSVEVTDGGRGATALPDDGHAGRVTLPMEPGMFAGCGAMESLVLPEGLGAVSEEAFVGCTNMAAFNLPDSVTNIGARAFMDLVQLTSIAIPVGVTRLGDGVFGGCSSLSAVALPKGLTALPDRAFAGCSSLSEIVVPEGVADVGAEVFDGCTLLRSVRFVGDHAPACAAAAYGGTDAALVTYVARGSMGWDGIPTSKSLPEYWPDGTTHDITFWEPNRFMVDFVADGGAGAVTAQVEQVTGTTYTLPPDATRPGATFGGWWTATDGGARVTAVTQVTLTRSHAFYAHWTFNRYMVHFDANGGEGEMAGQQMTVATGANLPDCGFMRMGYVFMGWATEPDGEVVYTNAAEVVDLAYEQGAAVTLYAVWEVHVWTLEEALWGADAQERVPPVTDADAGWTVDLLNGRDARYPSARSGEIGAAADEGGRTNSTLSVTVTGAGSGSFWWKVSCEEMDEEYGEWYDYAVFTIDGTEVARIAGDSGWRQVEYTVVGDGAHVLEWTFTRDDYDEPDTAWENAAWVDELAWTPVPKELTIEDAIFDGADAVAVRTGGNSDWTLDTTAGETALAACAKSGAVSSDEASWIELTLNGAGMLAFKWNVMGGAYRGTPFAYAKVEVDGVQLAQEYATSGWKEESFEIEGAGAHTVRWTYLRTSARTAEGDCAWVDGVVWTPAGGSADIVVDMGGGKSVTVPGDWLTNITSRIEAADGDVVAALASTAANRRMSVAECYVVGVDPEKADEDFKVTFFPMKADGTPDLENIVYDPPEARWRVPGARAVVKGAASLDGEWQAVTEENKAGFRFFKVEVMLP